MPSPAIFGSGGFAQLISPNPGVINSDGSLILSSGPRQYIPNGHFEQGIAGWSLFNTTLTSGLPTGSISSGASSLTMGQTSGNPIRGTYSMNVGFATAWTAGQGVISDAFTLDQGDLNSIINWQFLYFVNSGASPFNWSGDLGSQSLIVSIYDVTNSVWLSNGSTPGFLGMNSNSAQTVIGSFQSGGTSGQQYRIAILASQSVSSTGSINFDSFTVSPQVSVLGFAGTDPEAYTMTVSGLGAGSGTAVAYWSRVGKYAKIDFSFTKDATAGTGATLVSFSLPPGLSIDTSSTANAASNVSSFGSVDSNGLIGPQNDFITSTVTWNNTTSFYISNPASGGNAAFDGSNFRAGSVVSGQAMFPILGWSSNVQLSPPVGAPVVAFQAAQTAGQTIAASSGVVITGWNTPAIDTVDAFNASTGVYTVKASGQLEISAMINLNSISNNSAYATIYKNGSSTGLFSNYASPSSSVIGLSVKGILNVVAGDQIEAVVQNNSTSTVSLTTSAATSTFSISMIPSMAATYNPVIAARYTDTSGQTVGTSATLLKFATKSFDTSGSWSTNTFTAPVAGIYRVTAKIMLNAITLSTVQSLFMNIYYNGSNYCESPITLGNGTANYYGTIISDLVDMAANDTVKIYAQCSVSATFYTGGTNNNYITIEKVG